MAIFDPTHAVFDDPGHHDATDDANHTDPNAVKAATAKAPLVGAKMQYLTEHGVDPETAKAAIAKQQAAKLAGK